MFPLGPAFSDLGLAPGHLGTRVIFRLTDGGGERGPRKGLRLTTSRYGAHLRLPVQSSCIISSGADRKIIRCEPDELLSESHDINRASLARVAA